MWLSVITIKLKQWSAGLSPSHFYFSFGIISGRLWGSLAVEDHLRSILGITCGLGIICGRGSLAVLYTTAVRDHLRYCTVEMKGKNETGMNMTIKSYNAARAQVICEVESLIALPVTNIVSWRCCNLYWGLRQDFTDLYFLRKYFVRYLYYMFPF